MAAYLATGSDPTGSVELDDGSFTSILELASSVGKPDAELVFLLLAARADPNAVSPSGWSRADDPDFTECLDSFFGSDCDVLLEECRMMGRTGDHSPVSLFDEADVASFLQNLRQEDLLHAAAILCDVVTICQLVCHQSAFDPNKEIEINGVFACPLSLVYHSSDTDSALCLKSLIVARADPHMPLLGGSSAGWTLAAAARADQKHAVVKILQKIPMMRNLAIAHPATAAKWIWSRIRRVEVTTAVVESMLDYLVPCMYLDELVQEVLAIRAEPSEDEETFAVLYWRLAEQLLCLSAQYDDDKAVEQLLRASADVASHDDSERLAASTPPELIARFLTRPDRPAQVCIVARRQEGQRAARAEAARRWGQVQPSRLSPRLRPASSVPSGPCSVRTLIGKCLEAQSLRSSCRDVVRTCLPSFEPAGAWRSCFERTPTSMACTAGAITTRP